jgi:signal peptidase I
MDSPSFWQRLVGWSRELKSILLAVGFVLIVRTVLAEPYHVPSPSMVPTLLTGDQLVAAKYPYGYSRYSPPIDLMPDFPGRLLGKTPERGDVVVFRLPRDPSTTYVKRLIGLPGDRIQMKGGRLYINDAIVSRRLVGPFTGDAGGRGTPTLYVETLPGGREHEIVEMSDTDRYDDTPMFVVPPKHYFMMGDNRDNSVDSRIAIAAGGVDFVPEDNLVGRAELVLLSRDPAVAWFDVGEWSHVFRPGRLLGRIH